MPLTNPSEAQLYDHVHQLLRAHETLLVDRRRNRPFYRALQKHVRADSHVLDIGSGTGVWALAAARFGARRVVAIEAEPLLIEVIRELARANGVADRIEAIHGDSRGLSLEREFDVVISETIGHVGFDEPIVPVAIDARTRFLKPSGVLIPQAISLYAAAARFKKRTELAGGAAAGMAPDYTYFESLVRHAPIAAVKAAPFQLVSGPRLLVHADLTTIEAPPDLTNLTASWPEAKVEAVDGFAVWCEAALCKGVRLSTLKTTSWSPIIYPIRRFDQIHGDLGFKLTLESQTARWTASLDGAAHMETQTYSPARAAAELLARERTGGGIFSHYKLLGLLPE